MTKTRVTLGQFNRLGCCPGAGTAAFSSSQERHNRGKGDGRLTGGVGLPVSRALRIFYAGLLLFISFAIETSNAASLPSVTTEEIAAYKTLTFHSQVLDEERTLLLRTPEGYEITDLKYPVLVLLDAEYFFEAGTAVVQFLSECGYNDLRPIPQMIVVGIVNVDRDRDYTPTHAPEQGALRFPTSGGAARFLEFLEDEVIPLIEDDYRAQPFHILAGWSLGGLFATYTCFNEPGSFNAFLAISPSLWWDNQMMIDDVSRASKAGRLIRTPPSGTSPPSKLVVTLGSLEESDMGSSVRDRFVPLVEKNAIAGLDFSFVEVTGESHENVPVKAMFDGLRALFSNFNYPDDSVWDAGLDGVRRFYADLSRQWGYDIAIPPGVYSSLIQIHRSNGDVDAAERTAEEGARVYPGWSYPHYILSRICEGKDLLSTARDHMVRALELEDARPAPYSELTKWYTARLQELEEKMSAHE